ncbi:uncharacterized protein LOC134763050 [Penaeus indicus]|uniref:uncharacterized protein LOC134763050 n=1 Tax=Penaeus indicus TaxID=29960 RepID=UPI00300CAF74
MDSGRSAGAGMGGPRGLVAGVKAAFRSRSRSEKSRSRSRSRCENNRTDNRDEARHGKSERAPRSPFLGWARSRHKEQPKAKDAAKAKEVTACATEGSGPCSLLQAERLSLHSSEDYWHTSEDLRDIRRGTYTSFRSDFYDSRYAGEKENEKTLDRLRLLVDDGAAARLQDSREKSGGRLGRYVNLPVHCSGVAGQVPGESSARAGDGGLAHGVSASNHGEAFCGAAAARGSQGLACASDVGERGGVEGETELEGEVRVQGDGSDMREDEHVEVKSEKQLRFDTSTIKRYYNKEKTSESVRGSWLKSALSYNLEVPESPRNEVIVLALGIDQYIEEVFRFLDRSGSGRVGIEDFDALCQVLGLAESEGLPRKGQQRCQCLGSKLTLNGSLDNSLLNNEVPGDKVCPIHLNFSEFHDRLCERFVKGAQTETLSPLASRRPYNPRLVTSVVHIQRRYDILEKISKSIAEINSELEGDVKRPPAECPTAASACCTSRQPAHVDRNSNISPQPSYSETCLLKRQVLLQQQELQCLREVIEDMRVALQNSDAENLSLQVQMARSSAPSRRGSEHDLCLTDEEDTIDDLVRQLTELSRPRNDASSIPVAEVAPQPQEAPKEAPQEALQVDNPKCKKEAQETALLPPELPGSPKEPHNTAFVSGDLSLEAELQATYEALQSAREEQEATQADLQRTVSQLQQREADLKGAELSLQASYTALEKVQYDSHALVMEVAETRSLLEEAKERLTGALEELAQAKCTIQEQETQLTCAKESLEVLQNSRHRVVKEVSSARNLVAGSMEQVRAGEHALAALASMHAHSSPIGSTRLDSVCRADSGLYSEDSERDDDMKTPDRSTDHISASDDDLWSPRGAPLKDTRSRNDSNSSCSSKSPASPRSESDLLTPSLGSPTLMITEEEEEESSWALREAKKGGALTSTSTAIIEGLEKEVQWIQESLDAAEKEWDQEQSLYSKDDNDAFGKSGVLDEKLRHVEAERVRLALLEDKLRHLLQVLLTLADLNLSRRTLGRLILEAVEDAAGAKIGEVRSLASLRDSDVSPLAFLPSFLSSTSSYHTLSTETLVHLALRGLTRPPQMPELPDHFEATLG